MDFSQTALKATSKNSAPIARRDWVVLLHGLFATSHSMRKLETRIGAAGYKVLNWGYPTWLRSTEQNVRHLLPELARLQNDPAVRSINFVTHSMGGILARCALQAGSDAKVKRLVMLAPPNRGSHLTRISLGPFAWCLPAIAELSELPDSLPNRLEVASQAIVSQVEIGVIAASRDMIVPVENTKLSNQRDHCVLGTSHFRLPNHDMAVRYVLRFLQSGRFSSDDASYTRATRAAA
jgi:pimeloyl-ACP methyl ester carboxylesterase